MIENPPGVCSMHQYSATTSKTASEAAKTWSQQQHLTLILTNRLYRHGKRHTGYRGSLEKPVEGDHSRLHP